MDYRITLDKGPPLRIVVHQVVDGKPLEPPHLVAEPTPAAGYDPGWEGFKDEAAAREWMRQHAVAWRKAGHTVELEGEPARKDP